MAIGTLDRAASLNPWRHRALGEKALIGFGFLALALILPPWPGAALVSLAILGFTFLGARVPVRLWLATAALPLGFLATGARCSWSMSGQAGWPLRRTACRRLPPLWHAPWRRPFA